MRSWLHSLRRFAEMWGEDAGLTALLPLLFFVFFVVPLFGSGLARLLTALVFSLVMLAGVASLSGSPLVRGLAAAAVALAVLLRWLGFFLPNPTVVAASAVASLLLLVALTGQILYRVFRKGPVTAHRVRGAVAAYVLAGMCWALLYQLIDLTLPGSFSLAEGGDRSWRNSSLAYFSFVTLTTVGYGDITPVHPIARMCVIPEALFGLLYPATLLARLVSLELMYRNNPPAAGPPGAGAGGSASGADRKEE